jgi:hypothetical protein
VIAQRGTAARAGASDVSWSVPLYAYAPDRPSEGALGCGSSSWRSFSVWRQSVHTGEKTAQSIDSVISTMM